MVTIIKKFRTLILTVLTFSSLIPLGILFAAPTNLPLISRNCPVFVSDGYATGANDSNYGTTWRGKIPGWIVYDLSEAATSQRQKIVVAWYNNDTYDYDHAVVNTNAYNNLKAYTLEGNAAAGGSGSAPTSGWVPLVSVTGNTYHSRQHVLNFSGYNWLRLNITESDGSSGNSDASLNLDIHNAAQGLEDDWIFYGDSITAGGMGVNSNGDGTFAQQINAAKPEYFPIAECGGIGGIFSGTGVKNIDSWLKIFPGKYVCLAFGTNDAWGNQTGPANYYKNLETMVKAILAADKVPVISKIPWSRLSDVQTNVPSYNAKVDELYAAYPQVVKGPDFETYFKNNPSLISSDGVHPSSDGYNALRKLWAQTMLANVYNGTAPSASPTAVPSETPAPSVTVTPSPSLSPTITPRPTSGAECQATWVSNDWGSGATITITIKNHGGLSVTGWSLKWSFDGNQKITNLWNGEYQQTGNTVTVTHAAYNANLAPNGGTVTLGFNISYSGSNVKPTWITVCGALSPLH